MNTLPDQLEAARSEVARLELAISQATCQEAGHDWRHIGGKNAGCGNDCVCSVPVHQCSRCGGCDYGDNAEARDTIAACAARE